MDDRDSKSLISERFKSKYDVQPNEPDGLKGRGPCWIWNSTLRNGYPVYRDGDKMIPAHQVLTGPRRRRRVCLNKLCVAPAHLEVIVSRVDADKIKEALREPYWGIGEDLARQYDVSPALISKLRTTDAP